MLGPSKFIGVEPKKKPYHCWVKKMPADWQVDGRLSRLMVKVFTSGLE